MTKHLVPEEFLLEYAAGVLPEGASRLIAAHLTFSPHSRSIVRDAERLGGAMLEIEPATEHMSRSSDVRPWDMAALLRPADPSVPLEAIPDVPAPLRPLIGNHLSGIKWRTFWPGMQTMKLRCPDDPADVSLLRLRPGTGMPIHTHEGDELTLVLQGSYTDETGRYGVGDVAVGNHELTHQPVADSGDHCICLTVVDGPLRFRSPLARLASKLLLA